MGAGQQGWQLAATLDRPENFWGLETCPEDWARLVDIHSDDPQTVRKMPARSEKTQAPGLKIVSEKGQSQFSERDLRAIVAEFVQPLHAEIMSLKEKRPRRTSNAAASIFRFRTFRQRWKRNCGSGCARTWERKF